ncbi:AAA family ATPase [Embleya scabrispora]|uniref:AAA family ATPase n=1 Tax=Embleya scabrispora TaxID=159449 RepID=UPI00131A3ED3|nr:LuxR family transcriptional regulator [Embleya scabrispora]MYS85507.1 AAA family ATPase [Streptomyces sp. SID5474]
MGERAQGDTWGLAIAMEFIEREPEIGRLRAALRECAAARGGGVLVDGAVGCGKSEILGWVGEQASTIGAVSLSATGSATARARPLAILRQFLDGPAVPANLALTLDRLVEDEDTTRAARRFTTAVHEVALRQPVVVSLDDVQHADAASVRCLLHLARHSGRARVLVLLARTLDFALTDPQSDTEFLRQPDLVRIRLAPLSPAGVAELLTRDPGTADPQRAGEFHELTGGNPLLLRALIAEQGFAAGPATAPTPGGAYGRAVLTCLRRGGTGMWRVAKAAAVLDAGASAEVLRRLADTTAPATAQALGALSGAGLLNGDRLRPAVRDALLDSLDPGELSGLHRRAATVLRHHGAPAVRIAGHLLAARQAPDPWAVDVLREAAEEALDEDRAHRAIACLELAAEQCRDPAVRAQTHVRLAEVTGRLNPHAAEQRCLGEPLTALALGDLPESSMTPLARQLLSHGRLDAARRVLDRLKERTDPRAEWVDHVESDLPLSWLRHPHPAAPSPDPVERIEAAERLLRVSGLTDVTLSPLVAALHLLIDRDRASRAEAHARALLAESIRREAPGWQAVFGSACARAALCQGRLPDAEKYARQAMAVVPERAGSLFFGGPLANLICVYTEMGDYGAAAHQVNQPVDKDLFTGLHGLDYLRARGRYLLATDRVRAALADFLQVAWLVHTWGVDQPFFVPWRTDAAEALLRLDETERARELVAEQLRLCGPGGGRIRGAALRLRAMTVDVAERPALLTQAVEALRRSEDTLELARTLEALAESYRDLAEPVRAATLQSRVWHLTRDCGARPRGRTIAHAYADLPAVNIGGAGADLSESEKRVAALAASGYSNRGISEELFITVSTVEQHLTRVYRKLDIRNRRQLPAHLRSHLDWCRPTSGPHVAVPRATDEPHATGTAAADSDAHRQPQRPGEQAAVQVAGAAERVRR